MDKSKRPIDWINNPTSTAITFRLAFLFTEYRVIRKPFEYSLAKKLLASRSAIVTKLPSPSYSFPDPGENTSTLFRRRRRNVTANSSSSFVLHLVLYTSNFSVSSASL